MHHDRMKNLVACLFLVFSYTCFCQPASQKRLFNDTSIYFIWQLDSLHPVQLLADELETTSEFLIQAIDAFNLEEQRYADSVNPKKKKRGAQAFRLIAESYYFRLIPVINSSGEKLVQISGSCRAWYKSRKSKKANDQDWKQKFIDGDMVEDGGTCFISVVINLTLKEHGRLGINGVA